MATTPQLSHFGIFVRDIDLMTRFYTEVFDLRLTDQGVGRNFKVRLHFLSATAEQRHQLVLAGGASQMRGMNHGNALLIYFSDPEDNTVEVYLDTPWYVPQPHVDPLDLDKPDAEIWAETELICRADPGFAPVADWAAGFGAAR